MKPLFAVVVLFLAVAQLNAQEKKTEWVKLVPKDGNCEILFPVQPKEMPNESGIQFTLAHESGKAVLVFQFNTVSTGFAIDDAKQVKSFFDSLRDSLVKANQAKVVTENDSMLDKKYPVRELYTTTPGFGYSRMKMILSERGTLYIIAVNGAKEYQNGAEAQQFLKTFKITK